MIHQVFAVYDDKAALYIRPFMFGNKAEGIRAFATSAADKTHPFHIHAEDYTLFAIATYDDQTALYTCENTPVSLGKAIEYKAKDTS